MSGIVEGNPLVHEHANTPSSHSHFDLNSVLGGTYRFGELSPHFVLSAVADDKRASFMSGSDVRSLNLKSPLLQDVKMFKTYFQVPMPAILPLNWDKLYVQPNIGDDVVASNVGTTIEDFTTWISDVNSSWLTYLRSVATDPNDPTNFLWDSNSLGCLFRWLTWLKSIFSAGSLASQFGDNLWNLFHWYKSGDQEEYQYKYFDEFYDYVVKRVFQKIVTTLDYEFFVYDGSTAFYKVLNTLSDEDCGKSYQYRSGNWCNTISIRRFIEIIDNNPSFTLNVTDNFNNPNPPYIDDDFIFDSDLEYSIVGNTGRVFPSLSLNIDKYAAYQLACAEYFTNDKVDYVYSSELYRQLLRSCLDNWLTSGSSSSKPDYSSTFVYNGVTYLYDEFSAYFLQSCLNSVYTGFNDDSVDDSVYFLNYWMLIFGVRNSLRYKDYFVGAKPRPLAPVDVDVPVVSNKVSMVDVAVKKGYLRLAFAVNRIGRKFSKYSEEIMHTAPPVDYHHAWYLAETTDYIGNQETENTTQTSSSTNASTTISTLRSQSNRYAFETDIDINSIIIGITSFDINRLYDRTYSRFNTHFDRYDMFNPLLQFTGDQPVYSYEYDSGSDPNLYLGYQDKYMEYKMPISRCFGGLDLPRILPGWCIVATDRQNVNGNTLLSPSFIRSYPHEFDKFYSSLTGLSPATYFHFIIKHSNVLSIDRPMVAKPKIM